MRIRSGGQSGVDRAALDCALDLGLEYEGWCPAGGWAEDYPVPPGLLAVYPLLVETPSHEPAQRTEWNVRDSAATLILTADGIASPGTRYTAEVAARLGRPCLCISLLDDPDPHTVAEALSGELRGTDSLNVAGPRESGTPGVYVRAKAFLCPLFREFASSQGGFRPHL